MAPPPAPARRSIVKEGHKNFDERDGRASDALQIRGHCARSQSVTLHFLILEIVAAILAPWLGNYIRIVNAVSSLP